MKIIRATKCSLKFATREKRVRLSMLLVEYGNVVNIFIEQFWQHCLQEKELLKPIVDLPTTWLSARLRKVAAREAIAMVRAARERDGDAAVRPWHRGNRMCCSNTIATLAIAEHAQEFDCWLRLHSTGWGRGAVLDLPIRLHRHFNRLAARGRRLNSYIITCQYVQFCFKVDTGAKLPLGKSLGLDTGIKALASLSDGQQFGRDIGDIIEAIKRCRWGSKRQKRLRRSLRQRMDEVAKQVFRLGPRLVVVERLKQMNYKTAVRRRLTKNMRRSLGAWIYRYWLDRIQRGCEDNRVAFRSVPPQYTSQRCNACGHIERRNRSGEKFLCQRCGHRDNADINAAKNILDRFLLGPYGAEYQATGQMSW